MKSNLVILISLLLFGSFFPLIAQVNIKGRIFDEQNAPLTGVSVKTELNGKTVGSISDIDGNYSISKDENADIEFSFIGFATQTIAPNGLSIINVQMKEDRKMLDEAVVIGYGTVKKKDILGSVSTVREKAAGPYFRSKSYFQRATRVFRIHSN